MRAGRRHAHARARRGAYGCSHAHARGGTYGRSHAETHGCAYADTDACSEGHAHESPLPEFPTSRGRHAHRAGGRPAGVC